jgi:predicted RNA binding protein YcfA (HicA-like mRNA interferase family)
MRVIICPSGGGDMKSSEIIKILEMDGWYLTKTTGSHHHFRHPEKPGKVTVKHPQKDVPPKTFSSIMKQAGLK